MSGEPRAPLREARERLVICWAALRGRAVISHVTIRGGVLDLTVDPRPLCLSDAALLEGEILTPGPVLVTIDPGCEFTGNTGDALDYPGGAEYR